MRGKNLYLLLLATVLIASPLMVNVSFASPTTRVFVEPSTVQTNPEESFTVDINIEGAFEVAVWEFKMMWTIDLTEWETGEADAVLNPVIKLGDFFTYMGNPLPTETWSIGNYLLGYIQVGAWLTGPGYISGDGTLCSITFSVKESGTSDLDLYDVKLWGPAPGQLPRTVDIVDDGFFYTAEPFVDFYWTPTEILPGMTVTFNGSASYDPDDYPAQGPIDVYAWDFDEDGVIDDYGVEVTTTFPAYQFSPYLVTLTCTDFDGDTWSKTKSVRVWRDMAAVDIWPTNWAWDVEYADVFHGMIDPIAGVPYMEFIVTTTNFGEVTETYHLYLYMDLDTSVIGDEFVIMDHTLTLGPHKGSGFSHWGYLLLDFGVIQDCGLYTLTAIVESTEDQEPANDMIQKNLYIHARAEPRAAKAPLSPRHFKIKSQGDTFYFKGKVKNVEDPATNPDGIWARLKFEVVDDMGMPVVTVRTDADYVMNGEMSPDLLVATWEGITEADVGTYYVSCYTEFGWDGVNFPFAGTEPTTYSFTIVP